MLHENIHAKIIAQMVPLARISFGLLLLINSISIVKQIPQHFLRVIFSEKRESEDSHEKSIFLLFRQNIPFSELIQGKIV